MRIGPGTAILQVRPPHILAHRHAQWIVRQLKLLKKSIESGKKTLISPKVAH
jgi:hypothetical protein